ncbi:hypothetical protein EMQ25_05870 [Arsenicitalea aurantiaca]|uniref:Transporter n=1 Tax=Arsenicitalea aurantiaca TaxID=1783274 RepID=A0A433XEZ4_9HYPH|nr:TolC family outer membrane protein [Arsenicitalea aurantiaca]RUT32671.1 hypothetical protein EMQ25_05870 [Arsenicitalea aurantiaca]
MKSIRPLRRLALALAMTASLPGLAQAQSLREALEYAYTNNPNIASALLSVKSSAEDIALRRASQRPSIGLNADVGASFSVMGSTDTPLGPSGPSSSFNTSYGLDMDFRQNVFDNNRSNSQLEQARALTELSTYALRNQEQNVLLSVAQAYMNVVRDTQLVQLRQDNVAFFQRQVGSAEDRLRLGEGTRTDVSQAQTRLAQGVASYQAAIASLQSSQASFQRWVGRPPQGLNGSFDFSPYVPGSLDQAIASADNRHPAILTAAASVRASQAGADAARAAFGPTLNMIGSLCALGCFGGNTPGMSGNVGLQLSIPLYQGGALGATMRKANIETMRSEVDALAVRDQVRESVISAWSTLQNATAQIQSAQQAVSAGQLVVEGIVQERDVGQRTTLDVLDAQAELTTAREGLIGANASRVIAAFSLIAATGRLSPSDLGLRVEVKSAEGYVQQVEDVWQELRALQ